MLGNRLLAARSRALQFDQMLLVQTEINRTQDYIKALKDNVFMGADFCNLIGSDEDFCATKRWRIGKCDQVGLELGCFFPRVRKLIKIDADSNRVR